MKIWIRLSDKKNCNGSDFIKITINNLTLSDLYYFFSEYESGSNQIRIRILAFSDTQNFKIIKIWVSKIRIRTVDSNYNADPVPVNLTIATLMRIWSFKKLQYESVSRGPIKSQTGFGSTTLPECLQKSDFKVLDLIKKISGHNPQKLIWLLSTHGEEKISHR